MSWGASCSLGAVDWGSQLGPREMLPVAGPCLALALGARTCVAPKKLQYKMLF